MSRMKTSPPHQCPDSRFNTSLALAKFYWTVHSADKKTKASAKKIRTLSSFKNGKKNKQRQTKKLTLITKHFLFRPIFEVGRIPFHELKSLENICSERHFVYSRGVLNTFCVCTPHPAQATFDLIRGRLSSQWLQTRPQILFCYLSW